MKISTGLYSYKAYKQLQAVMHEISGHVNNGASICSILLDSNAFEVKREDNGLVCLHLFDHNAERFGEESCRKAIASKMWNAAQHPKTYSKKHAMVTPTHIIAWGLADEDGDEDEDEDEDEDGDEILLAELKLLSDAVRYGDVSKLSTKWYDQSLVDEMAGRPFDPVTISLIMSLRNAKKQIVDKFYADLNKLKAEFEAAKQALEIKACRTVASLEQQLCKAFKDHDV